MHHATRYGMELAGGGQLDVPALLGITAGTFRTQREIIDQAPAMIWMSDVHRQRIYSNKKWREFTGQDEPRSLGNQWQVVIHGEDVDRFLQEYGKHFNAKTAFTTQFRMRRYDDEYRWVECCGNPITVDDSFRGYIGHCIDIQQRKQQEIELINAKIDIEQAMKVKTEFLASVSHEIRTPLTGIILLAELLENCGEPEKTREYIQLLKHNSKFLKILVNDILDVAKMERGDITLYKSVFDLVDVMQECICIVHALADDKKIKMSFDSKLINGDRNVYADEGRLKQVVVNLLSNAVKFTPTGDISVMLGLNGAHYIIRIADTGVGIPPEFRDKLFTYFSQANTSYRRATEGTGLGLYLCANIVHAFSGEITYEPNTPHGSVFTVTVPLERAPHTPVQKRRYLAEDIFVIDAGAEVLIVEDNATSRMCIERMLTKYKLKCDTAENGLEAVKKATDKLYDLVFMDCQMPVMDGFDATRAIRKLTNYTRVPIVALTALAIPGDRERCSEAGMTDYLPKPFTTSQVKTILYKYLAGVRHI